MRKQTTVLLRKQRGYFLVPDTWTGVSELDKLLLSHFTGGKALRCNARTLLTIRRIAEGLHNCKVEVAAI
jgi:hypothetical protein